MIKKQYRSIWKLIIKYLKLSNTLKVKIILNWKININNDHNKKCNINWSSNYTTPKI